MKKLNKKITALGVSALLAFSVNASAVTVDLFDTDQAQLFDTTGDTDRDYKDGSAVFSSVTTLGSDILGTNRDLGVDMVSGGFGIPNSNIVVAGGSLTFNTTSGTDGQGIVQWDGAANTDLTIDTIGLGGVDLTGGGAHNAFGVDTLFSDGNFSININIWDMDGNFAFVTLVASEALTGSVNSSIEFDTFENCGPLEPTVLGVVCNAGNPGVDMTNVGAIELVINSLGDVNGLQGLALDLTLDSLQTVPEPSSLALLGLGLVGASVAGRRKNQKV